MSEPFATRRSLNLAVLRPYIASRRRLVAGALATVLVSAAVDLWVPVLIQHFIDRADGGAPTSDLVALAGVFLLASVVGQVLGAASAWFGARLGWEVTNDLRVQGTRHVTALDLDFHGDTRPGTLIERLDGDITAIAEMISRFSLRVVHAGVVVVGAVVILSFDDLRSGLALALWVICVVGIVTLFRLSGLDASDDERSASAELFGFIEEHVDAVDDLRANGAGPAVMERFRAVARRYKLSGVSAWRRRSVVWIASIFLFSTGLVLALSMGVWLVTSGAITLGTAYLFVQYFQRIEGPIEQVTNQMSEVQKAGAGLARLGHLLSLRPRLDRGGTASLPAGPLSVDLARVDFRYEEALVLRRVSLSIPAGVHVGLLGRTGSGKSTLMALLARFDDPELGTVRLGGVDLHTVARSEVRDHVAMITQGVHLMDGSIKDNITFFDHSVPDALVEHALAEIGLADMLEQYPDGIHTPVGEGGLGLSDGEAQLLSFARAYLRDPRLVLLDEPSSRLDPLTESRLTEATTRLLEGRTAVIIAHRLSTVDRVDRIVVLSDGEVVEDGDRVDLAADPDSHFARLRAAAGTAGTGRAATSRAATAGDATGVTS